MESKDNNLDSGSKGTASDESPSMPQGLTRQVWEIGQSVRRHEYSPTATGCTIERFTRMHPLTFMGGLDPIVAENRVQNTEKILEVLHCTDQQKVLYSTFQLAGKAERWRTMADEFSSLTRGTLTVHRYAARYIELSRFTPYLISNKYEKARRFEKGPRKDICRLVGMLQIREFSIQVDKVTIVEADL
ncbi:uncharacterized protein LOC131143862 [Malania oleifera]|uniref:uncharacterized protein LOC131143862 n=1 Tax=Malania oleifera TaxID=397392 RepID=UPI0025AE6464|nr:uncharacterized protein LOC131143862 [Malania oleifera]